MRVLLNFMERDTWLIHCLAEDCRTVLAPYRSVSSLETLRRLIIFAGAPAEEVEAFNRNVKRWGRGSIWLDLTPGGSQLLRIPLK